MILIDINTMDDIDAVTHCATEEDIKAGALENPCENCMKAYVNINTIVRRLYFTQR